LSRLRPGRKRFAGIQNGILLVLMIHEIGHQIRPAFLAGIGVGENVTALRIGQRP
jgi:hypothetical protein